MHDYARLGTISGATELGLWRGIEVRIRNSTIRHDYARLGTISGAAELGLWRGIEVRIRIHGDFSFFVPLDHTFGKVPSHGGKQLGF